MINAKINATIYAIKNYFSGYRLLKNPKNVSATTVKMIKKSSKINKNTLDTKENYTRITRDFSKPDSFVSYERLVVERFPFFDKNGNKIKELKSADLVIYSSDKKNSACFSKGRDIDKKELKNRILSGIQKPKFEKTILIPDLSLSSINFSAEKFSLKPEAIKKTLANIVTDKYLIKTFHNNSGSGFFKTLWQNLKK